MTSFRQHGGKFSSTGCYELSLKHHTIATSLLYPIISDKPNGLSAAQCHHLHFTTPPQGLFIRPSQSQTILLPPMMLLQLLSLQTPHPSAMTYRPPIIEAWKPTEDKVNHSHLAGSDNTTQRTITNSSSTQPVDPLVPSSTIILRR